MIPIWKTEDKDKKKKILKKKEKILKNRQKWLKIGFSDPLIPDRSDTKSNANSSLSALMTTVGFLACSRFVGHTRIPDVGQRAAPETCQLALSRRLSRARWISTKVNPWPTRCWRHYS